MLQTPSYVDEMPMKQVPVRHILDERKAKFSWDEDFLVSARSDEENWSPKSFTLCFRPLREVFGSIGQSDQKCHTLSDARSTVSSAISPRWGCLAIRRLTLRIDSKP